MIMDKLATFATEQAISATGVVGDIMDIGDTDRDIGEGNPLYVHILVTTAGTGSGTFTFDVRSSTGTNLIPNAEAHVRYEALTGSTLTKGTVITLAIPPGNKTFHRYLGLYVVESSTATVSVTAWLSCDQYTTGRTYKDAVN